MSAPQRSICQCIVLFFALFSVSGCKSHSLPELLQIESISQTVLEAGTQLEVNGKGFPEKQPLLLEFKGTLFSPGRVPSTLQLRLRARSQSVSTVLHSFTASEIGQFLGTAEHGTFRGVLQMSFESQRKNGATLRGSKAVVLDFISSREPPTGAHDEANRFLQFLGIDMDAELRVAKVKQGSLAELSGLAVGDEVLGLDEVRVFFVSDLIPRPNAQVSQLRIISGAQQEALLVPFHRGQFITYDKEIAEGSLLLLALCLTVVVVAARPPELLRLWAYHKTSYAMLQAQTMKSAWLVMASLISLLTFLRLAGQLREMALPLWVGFYVFLILYCAFIKGARRSRGGFGLLRGLSEANRQLLALLPLLIAVLLAAVEQGSLSLSGFRLAESAEGLYLLSSPWAFASGLAFFIALIPLPGMKAPGQLITRGSEVYGTDLTSRVGEFSVVSLLFLGVLLFLGRPELQSTFSMSAALYLLKCISFSLLLFFFRMRLRFPSLRESMRSLLRLNFLMSSFSVIGFALFTYVGVLRAHQDILNQFSWALIIAFAALLTISYFRGLNHWGRKTDPWL